jgi:arylformamidase
VPGYSLAPEATLADIIGEVRQALDFLTDRSVEFGFDRNRLFVGGWSAGGHLTAAVADHPAVRGGIPISGIFDLEPIFLGVLNDKLSLKPDEIAPLSPLAMLGDHSPPLELFVGGGELPELQRQSQDYAGAAQARGLPVKLTVLPGHHHFSILDELARGDGAIARALAAMTAAR